MSNYKELVLKTNTALKENCNTFGYTLKVLLDLDQTPNEFKAIIRKAKKDKELYVELQSKVRKTKKGHFRPFYTLQLLYKLNK